MYMFIHASMCDDVLYSILLLYIFLVSYAGERPWWPIQSPPQYKKEGSDWPGGEGDQVKFIGFR